MLPGSLVLTASKLQWTGMDIHWEIFQMHGALCMNGQSARHNGHCQWDCQVWNPQEEFHGQLCFPRPKQWCLWEIYMHSYHSTELSQMITIIQAPDADRHSCWSSYSQKRVFSNIWYLKMLMTESGTFCMQKLQLSHGLILLSHSFLLSMTQ